MTYGRDYGVKVDVPWYIKCPIINRFFNTMKVEMTFTTFSEDGGPLTGVFGTVRLPFTDSEFDISTLAKVKYSIANYNNMDFGCGLYVEITLLDVNHRKVYDKKNTSTNLSVGFMAKNKKNTTTWFGTWYDDTFDIKFGKRDYIS